MSMTLVNSLVVDGHEDKEEAEHQRRLPIDLKLGVYRCNEASDIRFLFLISRFHHRTKSLHIQPSRTCSRHIHSIFSTTFLAARIDMHKQIDIIELMYIVYAVPPSWKTSTYLLLTLLFDAWDLGRPEGRPADSSLGVLGVESASSVGTRLERILIALFVVGGGGVPLKSIAEAARAGGGVLPDRGGRLCPVIPGEAVCALEGRAGGGVTIDVEALACNNVSSYTVRSCP